MFLLSLIQPALAQDDACGVPFTEFELRTLVTRSDEALLGDDPVMHGKLFAEFEQRVPCLEGQLPKDAWARLLLNEAIVRRVQGKVWMPMLQTAQDLYADLAVPGYLLTEFSPSPRPQDLGPVDRCCVLFVDGVLRPRVPSLSGDHVAQVYRTGRWRSVFLRDSVVPAAWLEPDVVVETGPQTWQPVSRGTIGVVLGPTVGRQLVSAPADFLTDQQQYGFVVGAVSSGVLPVAEVAGVYWDGAMTAQVLSVRRGALGAFDLDPAGILPSAYAGGAAVFEDLSVGLGGGFFTLLRYEGEVPVLGWYPQPDVHLALRKDRADFGFNTGITPAGFHAGLSAGSINDVDRPLTLRVGMDGDIVVSWLDEEPPGDRRATALTFVGAFRVDAAWGRDR